MEGIPALGPPRGLRQVQIEDGGTAYGATNLVPGAFDTDVSLAGKLIFTENESCAQLNVSTMRMRIPTIWNSIGISRVSPGTRILYSTNDGYREFELQLNGGFDLRNSYKEGGGPC